MRANACAGVERPDPESRRPQRLAVRSAPASARPRGPAAPLVAAPGAGRRARMERSARRRFQGMTAAALFAGAMLASGCEATAGASAARSSRAVASAPATSPASVRAAGSAVATVATASGSTDAAGAALYLRKCGPCHGPRGVARQDLAHAGEERFGDAALLGASHRRRGAPGRGLPACDGDPAGRTGCVAGPGARIGGKDSPPGRRDVARYPARFTRGRDVSPVAAGAGMAPFSPRRNRAVRRRARSGSRRRASRPSG